MRNSEAAAAEEEEEEEEFYESRDRILSSSCSSTSCSDDDGDHHHRRAPRIPPPAATSYDVWTAEPASVEERRRRLLQQLGLIGDPALARRRPPARSRSDGVRGAEFETAIPVSRSKSETAVDLKHKHQRKQQQNTVPRPVPRSCGGGEVDRCCTIRNLDNGEEFVVKEDGMCDKLREVGSGRQLTMEEFEMCVGRSPIVQELMRRQNADDSGGGGCSGDRNGAARLSPSANVGLRRKKKGGWLKSIKNIAGNVVAGGYYRERRRSDERDPSCEKGGRRLSSATDDSQDDVHHGPERIRVRQYAKSSKDFTGLCMTQEIQAHAGSIWSIKFSLDGKYLASAGEDCVIHIWQVGESDKKGDLTITENGQCNPFITASTAESPESALALTCIEGSHWEKKRRARLSTSRKSMSSDQLVVPDRFFSLGEKPICSFKGHLDDVLDLSWSKSEYILSSSMDKTVRLWHMSSNSCLKTFSHSDYVTCIQFNPVDDRYFISGSLDKKVRIWSIPDRQIVDWNDLHEMITAACYTPDGQGALVGSHKGSCHLYDTSDNKLQQKSQIDLQNRRKNSKITGFQFAPGSSSEVLITSADSRIRVVDGAELVHKFRGFRNTSSQITASLSINGKYVVCASEDSYVYIWRYDANAHPSKSNGVFSVTQSHEHFYCRDVTVALSWPGTITCGILRTQSHRESRIAGISRCSSHGQSEANLDISPLSTSFRCNSCPQQNSILNMGINPFGDRVTATWPDEKLSSPRDSGDFTTSGRVQLQSRSAWGMVIVTAGRNGQIRAYQNFGFPF